MISTADDLVAIDKGQRTKDNYYKVMISTADDIVTIVNCPLSIVNSQLSFVHCQFSIVLCPLISGVVWVRGKKSSKETIYKVIAAYAVSGSYLEASRATGEPYQTVYKLVNEHKDKDEFRELENIKRAEFVDMTSSIINKGLTLIERKIDLALSDPDALDAIRLSEVTTAIGTIYDKRNLCLGDSTENVKITYKLPAEIDKFSV